MRDLIKSLIRKFATSKLLSPVWRLLQPIVNIGLAANYGLIVFYNDERKRVIKLIHKVKQETGMLMQDNEAYQIHMAVKRTAKGNLAEVGVYTGGSAKIICEAKGDRHVYLFDTFEGLSGVEDIDELFHEGQFEASYSSVKKYLKKYKNVHIYKGYFPDTSAPIKNKKFSFVHLDVDIYESTAKSLAFFYPRMVKGGIIMSHDYINAKGVRKAFDEFFRNKPEIILEPSGSQCLVVKL